MTDPRTTSEIDWTGGLEFIRQVKELGAKAERDRIRERIEREAYYMRSQSVYSAAEVDALRRALPLIEGESKND